LVSAAGFRPKWASAPRYWLLALALFAVVAAATFMVFRADLSSEEQDALTRLPEGRAVLLIMLAIGFSFRWAHLFTISSGGTPRH
jgi:hypothetical protein